METTPPAQVQSGGRVSEWLKPAESGPSGTTGKKRLSDRVGDIDAI